jgi:tRNA/rRNA methyltransferase
LALGGFAVEVPKVGAIGPGQLADAAQVSGMLVHLEQSLVALGFLDPGAPKKLMPRLNALFNRSQLTQEEIHILRGIAKGILQQISKAPLAHAEMPSAVERPATNG